MQRTSSPHSFGRAVNRPETDYVDGPPSPEFWRFLILAVFGMAAYETATWIWSVL